MTEKKILTYCPYAKKSRNRRVRCAAPYYCQRDRTPRKIFLDDDDRNNFIERLGNIIDETHTGYFAWALIPNHFHLLLRTGGVEISRVMQRILTGYAVSFNRKHSRHGHLFQNRYKPILCQEDIYLLELVRYIHLNPLRAGIVRDISGLEKYPYCGLSSFFVKVSPPWQDTGYVLKESKGLDLESVAKKVGKLTEIKLHDLFSSDRQRSTVQAKNLLCFWARMKKLE